MSFNNRPQSWRQNCGCLNNIKVCHSWWGYLGLFKVSFLNIAQVIPETRFWFCDWYWGVSLWAGKFGTLEYSRMNVTFHNIGGVILIFCYFFQIILISFKNISCFSVQGTKFGCVTGTEVCYCRQGVLEYRNILEWQSHFSLLEGLF